MPDTATAPLVPDAQPRRRPWWRRWLRRAAFAFVALILLVAGLYLTRAHTLHPLVCRVIAWAAPRWSDFEVEVGAISGDWWHGLEFEDLTLRTSTAHGPLRRVTADRAAVDLRLFDLLRGAPDALEALSVGTATVEVDLTVPPDPDPPPEDPVSLPDWLPLAEIDALDLDLRLSPEERLRVSGARLRSSRRRGVPAYELDLPAVAVEGPDPLSTSARLRLRVEGQVLEVDQLALRTTEVTGALRLDLTGLPQGAAAWSFDLAALDGRAHGRGALDPERATTELTLESLRLAHLADLVQADWTRTLRGVVELTASLDLPRDDPLATTAEVDLTARGLAYEGRALDEVRAEGAVARGEARVRRLSARRGEDHLSATDLHVPFEGGDLDALLAASSAHLTVSISDLTPWLHGDVPPEQPLPPHRIDLSVEVAGGRATLGSGRIEVADGVLVLRAGELELPAPPDRGRRLVLDLDADFDDLAPVGALLASEGWSGSLAGGLRFEGDLPRLEGRAQLSGAAVVVAGFELGQIALVATGDRDGLRLESASATSADLRFDLSGGYSFEAETLDEVALELEVVRPHRFAELLAPGGRLALTAHARGPWRAPSGDLHVTGLDLIAVDVPIGALEVIGSATDGLLDVTRLACETPYGALGAALEVSWPLDDAPLSFALRELTLEADGGRLALEAPASIELGDDGFQAGPLELAGDVGRLSLALALEGDALVAAARAEAFDPTPFLREVLTAEVAGLTLDLDGSYQAGRLELARLALTAEGTRLLDVSASLPLDALGPELLAPGQLRVAGTLTLPPERYLTWTVDEQVARLHGRVGGTLDLAGQWSAVVGRVSLDAADLRVTPVELVRPVLEEPAQARLELVLGGDRVTLEALRLDLPRRGVLTASGTVGSALDLVALAAEGTARFEDAALEIDGALELGDLAWMARLDDSLRRLTGSTSGRLVLRGTLAEPDVSGSFTLVDGNLKLADAPELEGIQAGATLRDGVLDLEGVRWEMGAAPVTLDGRIDMRAEAPVVDLRLAGRNVLLTRSGTQRIRGDLDLVVGGPVDGLAIGGTVGLRHSRILQEIDFLSLLESGPSVRSRRAGLVLPAFRTGPLATAAFDLTVKTVDPLRLLSNVARGNVRLDLHVGGTGEVLVPAGRVFLDDLRTRLPGGTVTFDLGLITFEQGNPYDPSLELVGDARLAGYDVQINVSDRLSDPTIAATSQPPLAPDELMLLILTGQPPSTGASGEAAARSLGLYLAKDLASKWMGGTGLDEDEDSFWNRLEIQAGRDVSKAGVMTLEVQYRWKEGYPGAQDAILLVAERDVHEDYNMGVRFVLRRR